MIDSVNPKCPFHSGVVENIEEACRRCDKLDTTEKDQWEAIGKKASTSSIRWGVVIGIMIIMAVLGAMWAMTDKLGGKIDHLTTITIEVKTKVDQHLKDGP